ncbi:MAG: orotate phosphoribosyltransferase [Candidatus Binatia bacterium]
MNEAEVHAYLVEHGAVQTGHFKLSSGKHSDTYVQNALVLRWPGVAERLGHELGASFDGVGASVVVGPALGGVVIAHEVARFLGLPMLFSERADGRMTLRRGFSLDPEDRVLVIEDTVSTGRSQREVIDLVRDAHAEVVGVGAIVDRSDGVSFGVPFHALLRLQAPLWEQDSCPLCAQGSEPVSPGSRHLTR